MRVALLQINLTVGALDANGEAILDAARRARELGADLAITSELALTGYPPRDLLDRPSNLRAVRHGHDLRRCPVSRLRGAPSSTGQGEDLPFRRAFAQSWHGAREVYLDEAFGFWQSAVAQ